MQALLLVVITQTGHLLICTQRRENFQRTRTVLLPNPDQAISEEQTYRETMSGIRSYMGWSNIPEMDSTTTGSDDNPFSGPKSSTPGKVSVQMPMEEWLCKKLSKLNVTLVEGYPSRSSEAGGLMMDQFLRPAKSQSKWYGLSSDHKADPVAVLTWCTDPCKLNSSYSRIVRAVWPCFYPSYFKAYFPRNSQTMGEICKRGYSHL